MELFSSVVHHLSQSTSLYGLAECAASQICVHVGERGGVERGERETERGERQRERETERERERRRRRAEKKKERGGQ